jgi:hypothetical protein
MAELQAENEQLKERIGDLEQNLRVAESARDDARAESQRYLDEKRDLRVQLEQLQEHVAVQPVSGPQHSRECGTAYRGCAPGCAFAGAQPRAWMPSNPPTLESPSQCPWILDDEDPDEGYWHCKHRADHVGVHETEFGKGHNRRWKMRGNLLPVAGGPTLGGEDFVGKSPEERRAMIDAVVMGEPDESEADQYDRATGDLGRPLETLPCACSAKYRELAPGVHAAYCPLAGKPLLQVPVEPVT